MEVKCPHCGIHGRLPIINDGRHELTCSSCKKIYYITIKEK